jgi:hypothetical protein
MSDLADGIRFSIICWTKVWISILKGICI